jgi:hypothetical protein
MLDFVTIGANSNDSDGFTSNGLVQTYENQKELDTNWRKHTGNAESELGVGVAISDGQTIAVGGPLGTAVQDTNVGEASVHYII